MLTILFFFFPFISGIQGAFHLHVQYFRQPEEYAYFKLTNDQNSEWSTYVHMNKSVNLRESEILELVKPLYDGPARTEHFGSNSITRHIGTQFAYLLSKYTIDSMIFENLCSQMKPKFSKLLAHSEQKPKKIRFVVEHPSYSFTLPDDFQVEGVGSEEFRIDVLGKASLTPSNFDADSVRKTRTLIIKQDTDFAYVFDFSTLLKIRSPVVLLEGTSSLTEQQLRDLIQAWDSEKFTISKWQIQIRDETEIPSFVINNFNVQIEDSWVTITKL